MCTSNLDDVTWAALLFNAARIPFEAFRKLCEEHEPGELSRGELFWNELGLTYPQQKRLSGLMLKSSWAEKELERAEKSNARFITAMDLDYPARLKDLRNPPVGLYVKGSIENLNFPSVGIVGTRKCSYYGKSVSEGIAKALARAGMTVISGGALGIDAAAHWGCLSENGVTFAIFGTGIDKVYPSGNTGLFERILERGALISEYPMGSGGDAWHFPERNRIIAGMSGRIVVSESPEGSGAMITAHLAIELGRELWAVPGRINEDVCKGSNRLIHDGANALIDIEEFVQDISGYYGQLNIEFGETGEQSKFSALPLSLSDDEKAVHALIQRQGSRTVDELLSESKLDIASLQSALLTLEASGLVIPSGSGRYSASV